MSYPTCQPFDKYQVNDYRGLAPSPSSKANIIQHRNQAWLSLVVGTLLGCTLLASLSRNAKADETLLEQTLNGATGVLLKVDAAQAKLPPTLMDLASENPESPLVAIVGLAQPPLNEFRGILDGETAFFALDVPDAFSLNARLHVTEDVSADQLRSLAKLVWPFQRGDTTSMAGWRTLHLGTGEQSLKRKPISPELLPPQSGMWLQAMNATGDFPVQLIVVPPRYIRETIEELQPELPEVIGGGSAVPALSRLQWFSFGMNPSEGTLQLLFQAEDAEAAKAIQALIPAIIEGLVHQQGADQVSTSILSAIAGLLRPTLEDNRVLISLEDPQQADAMLKLAASALASAAKPLAVMRTSNNLKQLVLGMWNHESAYSSLPTYGRSEDGKPSGNLSWRVHILPFIDEGELYRQFKLDEPWDSPHNIKLLERMPELFKPEIPMGSRESVKPYHTTYVAPIGEQTVFGQEKTVNFGSITDGASNTVAFVELAVEHAIPWTSPEEYRYDVEDPAAKLRFIDGSTQAAFMDGSVRALEQGMEPEFWQGIFTRNGGEVFKVP